MTDTATINLPVATAFDEVLCNKTSDGVNDVVRVPSTEFSAQVLGGISERVPDIEADRMLVDNGDGTLRETKSFFEVRGLLDPVRGIAGDGASDDTAALVAVRTAFPSEEIDLKGQTALVTQDLAGPFKNGYFKRAAYDEDADVLFPAENTLRRFGNIVDTDFWHAGWLQGNMWARKGKGICGATFSLGSGHTTSDNVPVYAISTDKFRSLKRIHLPFNSATERKNTFATDHVNGQLLTVVRTGNGTITKQQLFGTRLHEVMNLTDAIECFQDSSAFRLNLPNLGLKEDDLLFFENVDIIGGQDINGARPVTEVQTNYVKFSADGNANANVPAGGGTFRVELNKPGVDLKEIKFTGDVTFGEAIIAATDYASLPGVIFTLCGSNANQGTLFFGASGGGLGPRIIKVTQAFQDFATVAWAKSIYGITDGVEPSIRENPNAPGEYWGGVRTQDYVSDGPPAIWWVDNIENIDTVANKILLPNYGKYSPIDLTFAGDDIILTMSGDRTNPVDAAQSEAGTVLIYMLRANIADLKANGASALQRIHVANAMMVNSEDDDTVSVGVPGICAHDDNTVSIGWISEAADLRNAHGSPNPHFATIQLNRVYDPDFDYPVGVQQIAEDLVHHYRINVTVDDETNAVTDLDGKGTGGRTVVVSRVGEGDFDLTFKDAAGNTIDYGHGKYICLPMPTANNRVSMSCQGRTGTGFTCVSRDYGAASEAVKDSSFCIKVEIDLNWPALQGSV